MEIRISNILADLENGYTRTNTAKNYQGEGKSIAEKYNLNGTQVTELFKHPKLKGKKTRVEKDLGFTILDDTEENVNPTQEAAIEVNTSNDVRPSDVDFTEVEQNTAM